MATAPANVPNGREPVAPTSWAAGLYLQTRRGAQSGVSRSHRMPLDIVAPSNAAQDRMQTVSRDGEPNPQSSTAGPRSPQAFWVGLPRDWSDGSIDVRDIGGLACARILQGRRRKVRLADGAQREDRRYCYVLSMLTGRASLTHGGQEALLGPGVLAIVRSGDPWALNFDGRNSMLVLRIGEDELAQWWPSWASHVGSVISSGRARIVGTLIQSAFDNATAPSLVTDQPLRDSILSLLAKAASPSVGEGAAAPGESAKACQLLRRVQDFILSGLGDIELTPGVIAAAVPISERRLHRLFAATGTTLCRWIQQRRLDRCAADLANPELREQSITEIAFRWGFNDSAYFSRVFKKAFNLPPREFRANALTG